MVPAALGTQTAGSIIRPASYCGVYAMKPSFGLIPRTGILKTADTLDTVGFFTETPEMLRTMLEICRVDGPDYPITKNLKKPRKIKKIGILRPTCQSGWPFYALEVLDNWLTRLSEFLSVDEAPWNLEGCYDLHRRIYHKSLSYYFQKEAQTGKVSEIFKSQVEEGQRISAQRYQDDLIIQESIQRLADDLLKKYDILITLSSGGEAPEDERKAPRDTCLVWTLCGVPVINVPVFVSPDGLPFGLSIVARRLHDYKLFDFLETLLKAGLAPIGPNPRL
jgi:Asp-tRNA(Asn)/Glu-tRNA(Gln) amidotransferase A subunit family amidase